MPITLTAKYLAELNRGNNTPDVIVELTLAGGALKLGKYLSYTDVNPCLKSVSSVQNKLDPESGWATRGEMSFVIVGRDNFKSLVKDNFLMGKRVIRKDGFIATGWTYADYIEQYTGKIVDWKRKGDEFTIYVADDMVDTTKKIPVENATGTQLLDYRNTNPVDIISGLLSQSGVSGSLVDSTKLNAERDTWYNGWKFDRVLTEPKTGKEYLNELQVESNSFLFHDGAKISLKAVAPPLPGQSIQEWREGYEILHGSISESSGYKERFYNRVVVCYDYDESGSDSYSNFESVVIAGDAGSQTDWGTTTTKVIKSKWIRSHTYTQPTNTTGVKLFQLSKNNGAGSGTLTYDSAAKTLTWTPPGGTVGEAVKITKSGKFQVFGSDKTKWVRVLVVYADLAGTNKTDNITITYLSGELYASALAQRQLNYYRNPAASISFEIDLNDAAWNSVYVMPTDLKHITTDEAFEKGEDTWAKEVVMLTSVRPDIARKVVQIEAVEAKWYHRAAFVAPNGQPNYSTATAAQREYAYIGDNSNMVNGGTELGYYII